jgi:hypothetical protein
MRESGRSDGLVEIAGFLQQIGESRFAMQLITGSDWAAQSASADVAAVLAQCLGLIDQHAAALQLIELARARHAATPMLSYARATTLRHLGRGDEATAEYRRCLELAPDHAAAILMLAQHAPSDEPARRIDRARALLARIGDATPQSHLLHYALFFLLDAEGDTAAAWAALARGMALKRRELPYDAAAETAACEALTALCTPSFLAATTPPQTDHVPIFIVGLPRTGTTVLERILGNHSQVASAGELNDFHHQLCWEADAVAGGPWDRTLHPRLADLDYAHAGEHYLLRTRWRAGTKRFLIDKFPQNFAYAGLIRKALPQARILCLVRDPMDSCLSNLKEPFAGDFYPYSYDPVDTAGHCLRFRRLLAHWNEVMPGAVLAVHHEDLVADPEATSRRVMAHCGLPFEAGCADLTRNTSPSATASSSQIREPLHARGIGAWRRYAEPLAAARALLEAGLPAEEFRTA